MAGGAGGRDVEYRLRGGICFVRRKRPDRRTGRGPHHARLHDTDGGLQPLQSRVVWELPAKCIITWQRKNGARGYFASRRFKTRNGDTFIDEIALNPAYFAERTTKEILSTLFHEMVHVWQQHHGTPSRTGYHNAEWARKMEELGLIPSSSGEPGGDKTGQRVSHYIEVNGQFDRACNELLERGAEIEFVDSNGAPTSKKGKASAPRNKITYSCAGCRTNTWGKPGLNLICGDCQTAFVAA